MTSSQGPIEKMILRERADIKNQKKHSHEVKFLNVVTRFIFGGRRAGEDLISTSLP